MPDTDKASPRPWMEGGAVTGPRASIIPLVEGDPDGGDGFRHGAIWVSAGRRLVALVPRGEGDPHADRSLIVRAVNAHDALVAALTAAAVALDVAAKENDDRGYFARARDDAINALKLAEAP